MRKPYYVGDVVEVVNDGLGAIPPEFAAGGWMGAVTYSNPALEIADILIFLVGSASKDVPVACVPFSALRRPGASVVDILAELA